MKRTVVTASATVTVAALGAASIVLGASSASADDRWDRERERSVNCSAGSWATLSVEREARNRLEVDFEVENAPRNQQWNIRVKHDGKVAARTTRVSDYEGDLDMITRMADRPGRDTIRVRARSDSGEVCRVVVRF
jgi:hypothetical protein